MKLSKRLEVLKLDTQHAFKKHVPNREHVFHDSKEKGFESIIDDLTDRDVITELPKVYFNTNDGSEVEGYVLSVSRDNGLKVFNYTEHELANIGFSQINLLHNQIKFVEVLKKL